jgi:hypothetical protein
LAEARSAVSGATNSIKKKAAETALAEATTAVAEANRKYSDFWDRVEGKRSTPGPETPDNKPAPTTVTPPPKAVEALRSDPKLKAQFEAKYGKGSADQYLRK